MDADGVVKISDFGISKKNEYREAYQRVTRMSMQGSIPWMAPEVARGKGYSAKVDIWSLGCLVLEMLTNQTPWHKVRGNIIYLLGTGNAPPLPPGLSDSAKAFIERCFTIDPDKRPTATDLITDETFTDVEDPLGYDFRAWTERVGELKAQRARDGLDSEFSSMMSDEKSYNITMDDETSSIIDYGDEAEAFETGTRLTGDELEDGDEYWDEDGGYMSYFVEGEVVVDDTAEEKVWPGARDREWDEGSGDALGEGV